MGGVRLHAEERDPDGKLPLLQSADSGSRRFLASVTFLLEQHPDAVKVAANYVRLPILATHGRTFVEKEGRLPWL